MSKVVDSPAIREILLTVVHESQPKNRMSPSLQQSTVLDNAARRLAEAMDPAFSNRRGSGQIAGFPHQERYGQLPASLTPEMEEALLTQWGELFRTGILAWGLNLSNPNPPFFHLTEHGKKALANASRDPSNPAGYLRHLDMSSRLSSVSRSYLVEGLECYVAGLTKSAAVMIGTASESIIVELASHTQQKLNALGQTSPKGLSDWKIKTLIDSLKIVFDQHKGQMATHLRESMEANWPTFTYQIRATRNEAGHPTSVDPVTTDRVHAALLAFPEVAKLAKDLSEWVANCLT